MRLIMSIVAFAIIIGHGHGQSPAIAEAMGEFDWKIDKLILKIYTYRPAKFDATKGPIVFVFHGINRNADEYHAWAKPIGDTLNALIVTPCFDKENFPTSAYQQGNLFRNRQLQAKGDWTWSYIPKLAAEIRKRIDNPKAPYSLIGHSAGGQFVVRLAGFADTEAIRIVAANPGTHLFPTRDMKYPLGFGGLPEELSSDEAIKRYLAKPLTFYLGTADTETEKNFDKTPEAMKQGGTRYERGQNVYTMAVKLAKDKGWKLNWSLVEAKGVGHFAEKMFAHPNCKDAIQGITSKP